MNIRSLSNPAQVLAKDKIEASNKIKSDETADREANGQQPFSDQESHRPLTEEEAEAVVQKMRDNEGIQASGLIVKLYTENDQKMVKIENPDGKVVKRFVEKDLYFFMQESKDSIHLVNKTA